MGQIVGLRFEQSWGRQACLWMGLREQTGGTGDRWEGQGIHSFVYSNSVHQAPCVPVHCVETQRSWMGRCSQSGERDRQVAIPIQCHTCSDRGRHWWASKKEAHLPALPWGGCEIKLPRPHHHWAEGISWMETHSRQWESKGKGRVVREHGGSGIHGEARMWVWLEFRHWVERPFRGQNVECFGCQDKELGNTDLTEWGAVDGLFTGERYD